jgi:hypothetical protein
VKGLPIWDNKGLSSAIGAVLGTEGKAKYYPFLTDYIGHNNLSVVCRFGVEIKKLQRQSFVSSLSASRVVRAGDDL